MLTQKHNHRWSLRTLLMLLFAIGLVTLFSGIPITASAQTAVADVQISFNASGLAGENLSNPTSLQFGPDGRLYVSQQNGNIYAYTVQRNGPNDYQVTDTEFINLVKSFIPNHDDDGQPKVLTNRQITGILLTGTPLQPVMYVSSSDSRIGAGGGASDTGLDTNSGVISRLICNRAALADPCNWDKVDLVRGLPRSEENHSTNGLQIDEVTNTLYVASSGNTNAGAPSNNFAFTTEYALATAILTVDLDALDALPVQTDTTLFNNYTYQWVYDLPTLDDPTRDNVNGINDPSDPNYDGIDPNDPFGGNDGLNQAKVVENGPVQIFSPGWRNLYDLVITENGRIYAVDNGANKGWGGHPEGEQDYPAETTVGACTNNYIPGEPGSTSIGPGGDPAVNNQNGLHFVRELVSGDYNYVQPGELYYAGHPTPIRGNPAGAGLYTKSNTSTRPDNHTLDGDGNPTELWRNQILDPSDPNFKNQSLPVDWPPVPVSMANPAECDFRNSGETDGALSNYGPSTNGIAEYTATNFEGALQGNLLLAAFNGNIYRVILSADGKVATNCPTPNPPNPLANCTDSFASGFGSTPLDVIAQGDDDIFGGTVWAVTYGSNSITIFEPADYNGQNVPTCTGADDDTIDEDGDGYTNHDELQNGTNPCSNASKPEDNDGTTDYLTFKRSDLLDPDDDNDTLLDTVDRFPLDAANGITTNLPIEYNLFNNDPGFGIAGLGFTGLMANPGTDYYDLQTDPDRDTIIFGGTSGLLTIPGIGPGDAKGSTNTQTDGFQFGVNTSGLNTRFTVETKLNTPFYDDQTPQTGQVFGLQVGTGDQSNFLQMAIDDQGIVIHYEENDVQVAAQSASYNLPAVVNADEDVRLLLSINPTTGEVLPRYAIDSGPLIDLPTLTLSGNVLTAVQGNYTVNGAPSAMAVGLISTAGGSGTNFAATWDYFRISEDPSDASATIAVNSTDIKTGSTFNDQSFNITNTSQSGIEITKVELDLSTAAIPDLLFDPDGTAGDTVGRGFTPSGGSETTTGVTGHTFTQPFEQGYFGLEIDFNGFAPSESLVFGADIDPLSNKGTSAPGPNDAASVSGLELTGATVTVTFSNGDIHEVELYRTQPDSDTSSTNIIRSQVPTAPSIDMLNVSNQMLVPIANQTIRVSGPVQSNVKLLQFETGMFLDGLTGPYVPEGYQVDPWETNSVIGVYEYEDITGNDGTVDFNVTLVNTDDEAGYNIFAAVVADDDGTTSDLSNVFIVRYDENAGTQQVARINAGGPQYADTESNIWSADQLFSGGGSFNVGFFINGTDDDPLYQSERTGTNFSYAIPVTPGNQYFVDLLFAEIFYGAPGGGSELGEAGRRVFDVTIEGNTVLDDYDIFADVGARTATTKTFGPITAIGSTLNINFVASVDNAKVSGIHVYEIGTGGETPITLTNTADQRNRAGDTASLKVNAVGGDGSLVYEATGLPPGLSLTSSNGQITGDIDPGAAANSPYTVNVTVDDSDNDDTDVQTQSFQWTVQEPIPANAVPIYRVNNGGPELADEPINWSADQPGPDGTVIGNAQKGTPSPYLTLAAGTGQDDEAFGGAFNGVNVTDAPNTLFTTERFNDLTAPFNMQWDFPVTPGRYVVNLYFAEIFPGGQIVNTRVFDVAIEDVVVLDDFDRFAQQGTNGFYQSFDVEVADNNLDIDFTKILQNPSINGIEILEIPDTAINLQPIANQTNFEGDQPTLFVIATGGDGNLNYSAQGLPPGLSIEPTNGQITGTIDVGAAANSPYNVTITVDDSDPFNDDAVSTSFAWSVSASSLGGVVLTSPVGNIAPIVDLTLTWDAVPGAVNYEIDVYSPSGILLTPEGTPSTDRDILEASSCNGVCTFDVPLNGEYGEYTAWIRAYSNTETGPWAPNLFTVDPFPQVTLSDPTDVVLPTAENTTLVWNSVEGATAYYVDVYGPSGQVDDIDAYPAVNCGYTTCEAVLPLTGVVGDYSVFIIPTAENVFFGEWATSGFRVDWFDRVGFTSPLVFPPQAAVTLTWEEVPGATGYAVNVTSPNGALLTAQDAYTAEDLVDAGTICNEGTCTYDVTLQGEVGEYSATVVPYDAINTGTPTNKTFTVEGLGNTILNGPTETVSPVESQVTIGWNAVPHATDYFIDVYSPSGAVLASEQFYDASNCDGVLCSLDVTLNNEQGEHQVYIIAYADNGFFGEWTFSTFDVGLGAITLISPSASEPIDPAPITTITFAPDPLAAYTVVDVYGPDGAYNRYIEENTLCTDVCTLDIATNGVPGTFEVWTIPGIGADIFGPWARSTFEAALDDVTLLSPVGTILQAPTLDLVFEMPNGAGYTVVDVYYPNGGYDRILVETSDCPNNTCTVSISSFGLSGSYDVWMIPGVGPYFGNWSLSSFTVEPSFNPIDTAEVDVIGSAVAAPPPLDTSEVEAAIEGPGN